MNGRRDAEENQSRPSSRTSWKLDRGRNFEEEINLEKGLDEYASGPLDASPYRFETSRRQLDFIITIDSKNCLLIIIVGFLCKCRF